MRSTSASRPARASGARGLVAVALFASLFVQGCSEPAPREPTLLHGVAPTPPPVAPAEAQRGEPVAAVDPAPPPLLRSAGTAPTNAANRGFQAVTVFYGTDRKATGKSDPESWYGTETGAMSFGFVEVSIPRGHRIGAIERPLLGIRLLQSPRSHVVLLDVTPTSRDAFLAAVVARVRRSEGRNALVFVHGYNVSFESAAQRTAQIYFDLKFDGVPVFYSWPSQGELKVTAYRQDEAAVERTGATLQAFLADVVGRSGAENVYLIGHSLGTRALTAAIVALSRDQPDLSRRIREVILTAPDIDATVFRRDIAPRLAAASRGITLYASADDKALAASRSFKGVPLAGDIGRGVVLIPGIETIDASGVDTSFLGHSYYAENRSVLSDIFYLVREGKRAPARFDLEPVRTGAGIYWRFRQ